MSSPQPEPGGLPDIAPGTPLGGLARAIAACLRDAGIPTPDLDARILVCHFCGMTHEQLVADPDSALAATSARALQGALMRRLQREPVSRIVGSREFRGLDFTLSPQTLDPRPDTETLVEAALTAISGEALDEPVRVLDLGTGSGCILVSLLHAVAHATGTGTDIDAKALTRARANAAANGVAGRARFICTRWADRLKGPFDLVVSNPPYIPSREIDALEPEVALHDPRRALDGGEDGLDAYREIMGALASVLAPGGWVIFEVGAGQDGEVAAMMENGASPAGFSTVTRWPDLSGRVRCVGGKRSPRSV